jgi:hypothetical protein
MYRLADEAPPWLRPELLAFLERKKTHRLGDVPRVR